MNYNLVKIPVVILVFLFIAGCWCVYSLVMKKLASPAKYGSLSWFVYVANILEDRLMGIELDSKSKGSALSPVRVIFIVTSDFYDIPAPVMEVTKLKGYQGLSQVWRGKGKGGTLMTVIFDFDDKKSYPSKRSLAIVAAMFGLIYTPIWLNSDYYTSFLKPKLFW